MKPYLIIMMVLLVALIAASLTSLWSHCYQGKTWRKRALQMRLFNAHLFAPFGRAGAILFGRRNDLIALANSAPSAEFALSNSRQVAFQKSGVVLANDFGAMPPGTVCLPNDSMLRETTPIMELSMFAASYDSMVGNGLARLRDFLAPARPTGSRTFRLTTYSETEPWETVDYNKVKMGMLADAAEVRQRTVTKSDLRAPRRGLSVILDNDELKEKPEWQQMHTKWLIDILNRATVLEAVDVLKAAALQDATVWDGASDPDIEIRDRVLTLANTTGFYPQCAAYGDAATQARYKAYRSQLTAGSLASSMLTTEEQIATATGVNRVLINAERYQSSQNAKSEILGKNVFIFTSVESTGPMDPSNLVRHVVTGAYGSGEYAVFVVPIGATKTALIVINYEYLHAQHTTGVMEVAIG